MAWADCIVGAFTVDCSTTTTTDTTFPTSPPVDREYQGVSVFPIQLVIDPGATIDGFGLSLSNAGSGGVTVTNGGAITVTAGNTPTAGGTAALTLKATGGPLVYTGGSIVNNGNGNAFDASQVGGVGSVDITVTGDVSAASGEGIVVRNVTTSTDVTVTTGAVTALTGGKDGIDVQAQSLTGDVTIVANGDIKAGNAGIVGAILQAGATGNVSVTAGEINARFGVDAENFGAGSTTVDVGDVTTTDGNGVFARTAGGDVIVTTGAVTADSNIAIVARQTKAAGAGVIDVTTNGDVSGTLGIEATNSGTGAVTVTANGAVTGTADNGIEATGNGPVTVGVTGVVTGAGAGIIATSAGVGAVSVTAGDAVTGQSAEGIVAIGTGAVTVEVAGTVTGVNTGLLLTGGTGGTGDISVTGTGGFVGGSDNAATIKNNGSGTVTVDISGDSNSTSGEGIVVRDTTVGGDISITTGAVTALAGGKDGIDVQAQSLTGDVTIVANGDIKAGNAGIVGAILQAGATGNVSVTAGDINARFGVDAENFGAGSTTVDVGDVTTTDGNGVFARTAGGDVIVTAGAVTADSNIAIVARQTKAAAPGVIDVTATGDVSGTLGIEATNSGTGAIAVTAGGAVTGTAGEGIKATGNDAVTIKVADTVTGSTIGLNLVGGTGGSGDISVTGTGGFVGGTDNAATIKNNGSGTVTVNISGDSSSTSGEGIVVRDTTAGGDISVTTGAMTALTGGKDGIDVQAQSLTGDVTIVANGDIKAGNAGIVGAILQAGATGNVSVTAGDINARFGVDAENFGAGSTTVDVGDVTTTDGNGVFARTAGGDVIVTTGAVTADSNIAIVARQTKAAGAGVIDVTTNGDVSGTLGIEATNSGTGAVTVTANGAVTGTADNGIEATGNGPVTVGVTGVVTGAGAGIIATSAGVGAVSVTAGDAVTGQSAEGIVAIGTGAVTVEVAGTVTGVNTGLLLTGGTGGTGDISVTGTGGFVGGSDNAATIKNNGSGTVTVDISGDSSSTSGEGIFVRDTTAGGDISVTTGAVTALTGGKDGIDVQAQSLTGDVTIVANGDIKAGNAGIVGAIFQAGAGGDVSVTANGDIDARFGVDAENFGSGDVTVATVGSVTATSGNGIFARTNGGGDITVTAGDVGSTGNSAIVARNTVGAANTGTIDVTQTAGGTITANDGAAFGIETDSGLSTGTTTINVNGAINAGAAGIKSTSTVGDIVTNISATGSIDPLIGIDQSTVSGAITLGNAGLVEGDNIGVQLVSTGAGAVGDLTVNLTGTGTINGIAQQGVLITGADAEIVITGAGAATTISGGTVAVEVSNTGVGGISIADNTISGGTGGILATTTGINSGISVTGAGDVTTTLGTGIDLLIDNAASNGDLVVNRSGLVSGEAGIVAETIGGGDITIAANVTATNGDGITALNSNAAANTGTIGVTVAGGQTVTTTGGSGIVTNSGLSTGLTSIAVDGAVVGGTNGVIATATAGGIKLTGAGTISGGSLNAVDLNSTSGDIDVLFTGSVTAALDGIRAISSSGDVTVSGTGAVNGINGFGILASSSSGNVVIAPASTVTSTGGEGIRGVVGNTGTVTVTTVGKVSSTGIGIQTQSTDGLATITTGGSVVADGVGIIGNVVGDGSVIINANGGVTSTTSTAVIGRLQGAGAGTITITQAAGTLISGATTGISAESGSSTGATLVTVNGEVAGGGLGVSGTSKVANISVVVTATGKSGATTGVDLSTISGALAVSNAGLITGSTAGVNLAATGAATGVVTNSGTITGGTNAVRAILTGGAFSLNNTGTLNGALNVFGSAVATSTVTNAAAGIVNFGTGSSSVSGNFANAGVANIGVGGSVVFQGTTSNTNRINFAGAGAFTTNGAMTNTGVINAQNNLTTNLVTVGGNYTGGGQFFVDYNTVTATADRLNITGTASGNTNVTMNRVGPRTFVPGGFLPVVTVTPGAAANTFTSNTIFPVTGFILDSFGQNPDDNRQFGLIQEINPTATALGALAYIAEAGSALLDEPISVSVIGTDTDRRFNLWIRGGGGSTEQTVATSISGGGIDIADVRQVETEQVSLQLGADVGFLNAGGSNWDLHIGLTGGWYDADGRSSGAEQLGVEASFLGGYVVASHGAFLLDATVRKEWRTFDLYLPVLFDPAGPRDLDGSATAASVNASYRFGSETGLRVTPFVGFNYADSEIDDLQIDPSTTYLPGGDTTKIGQLGLRVSYPMEGPAQLSLEPFAGIAALKNWSSGDEASFVFNAPATEFVQRTRGWDDAIRYSLGVTGHTRDGQLSGFVTGTYNDGSELESYSVNAGFRLSF